MMLMDLVLLFSSSIEFANRFMLKPGSADMWRDSDSDSDFRTSCSCQSLCCCVLAFRYLQFLFNFVLLSWKALWMQGSDSTSGGRLCKGHWFRVDRRDFERSCQICAEAQTLSCEWLRCGPSPHWRGISYQDHWGQGPCFLIIMIYPILLHINGHLFFALSRRWLLGTFHERLDH